MAKAQSINISRNEFSVACTLYNNSMIEEDSEPITIEDIIIVTEDDIGKVDVLDEKGIRNRR